LYDERPRAGPAAPVDAASRPGRYRLMEKIIVHAKFHTGHRQIGYPGKCRFVHGHTWRGSVTIRTQEFPRDEIDMSLDFGDLKNVMRKFDHKMIVTASDLTFMDRTLFEPEGLVVIKGKGPSVENVALHVLDEVVALIRTQFPDRGLSYDIEVTITETENNIFSVDRTVVI
jgi:6-pyruvoyltetrahydropterin/6-carboxytetrahydropterin synthase